MDIEKIKIFLTVVEEGSLYAAGKKLDYTTSGISRSVTALEEETGLQLLLRGKKGISLTKDAENLLPSAWCQSDDLRISNAVNNIIAGLPADATEGQKLAALHDWEIHKLYYDYDSLTSGKRKIQDASHVLEYGMGVCEGYANLFTAMERLIGVKGTIICANYNNHAWNNTYYKNNWLLVDTTWDDPSDSNNKTDAKPYSESYTYFLITAAQDKLTDTDHGNYAVHPGITATGIGGDGINDMRQIDTTEQPYARGMPNGWY